MKNFVLLITWLSISISALAQQNRQSNWQQEVSYVINATLNDVDHRLDANLYLEYVNHSPDTLKYIIFHLWPNAYKNNQTAFAKQLLGNNKLDFQYSKEEERGWIDGLEFSSAGVRLHWNYDEQHIDIAKVWLSKALAPGERVVIETPFKLKIPIVFSRLGHQGQEYYMTQWYPKPAVYDVNGWNAMPYLDQGEFYSEFGDFTVKLTLPENYITAATGELMTPEEKQRIDERKDYPLKLGKDSVPTSSSTFKTVEYHADQVHDFAWFASKKFNVIQSTVEVDGREVQTQVFAHDPKEVQLKYIAHAVRFYSDEVGAYPYPHATVVHGQLKAGGGMEYPMITICTQMSENVIVHEVGHNWFYGILASNERVYPWMDEGVNSFFDSKATASDPDHFIGRGLQGRAMGAISSYNYVMNQQQSVNQRATSYTMLNYGISVYHEGARAFGLLHAYLGDERFKVAMRAYYKEYAFRHPLPGDMKATFEASTAEDLSWFFDGVLLSTGSADHKLYKKGVEIYIKNKGDLAFPVPVVFSTANQEKTVWVKVEPGQSTKLKAPLEHFTSAIIDPYGLTLDLSTNNNALKTSYKLGVLTGKDKYGTIETYVVPMMGWNAYDKFQLGLTFHGFNMNYKPFQYVLSPMYSFKQKKITGRAHIRWYKRLSGKASLLELGLKAQKFTWAQNYNPDYEFYQSYDYIRLRPSVTFHLPKKSLRSKKSQQIELSYTGAFFTPEFDLESYRLGSQNPRYRSLGGPWQFFVATYRNANNRALNSYAFEMELEHGRTTESFHVGLKDTLFDGTDTTLIMPLLDIEQSLSTHTKISAALELNLDIGMKKKPMKIRVFASYFLKAPEDGYFKHSITYTGNQAFRSDYRFDEFTMFRSANVGMLRNQIPLNGSRSRFVGILGQSDKMIANLMVSVPLPGKIPVKAYGEFMTFTDIDQEFWNESESSLIYQVGLELQVIPRIFSVYFNLAQSGDVTAQQEQVGIDQFKERITFTLNLNAMERFNLLDLMNL